ncbi:MAG: alcohol dehydrogenase catalytic domain-containing protein, partial [Deltaproteobacteria bacterium]|nr:alcohol dehydrogenase catalytic domain-containing protein [Deltaproteobacteria bacterium]
MKALQLDIHGRPTITDVPLPDPGKNEILLRVTHCAICRTDARMSLTGHRDLCLPRIPGHEICGLEERTGSPFVVWPGQVCG